MPEKNSFKSFFQARVLDAALALGLDAKDLYGDDGPVADGVVQPRLAPRSSRCLGGNSMGFVVGGCVRFPLRPEEANLWNLRNLLQKNLCTAECNLRQVLLECQGSIYGLHDYTQH